MPGQNTGVDMYPNIMLHDCTIQKIVAHNVDAAEGLADIALQFDECGFVKKAEDDRYYRAEDAALTIRGCSLDDLTIKEIRTHKLSEDSYFDTAYDLDKSTLLTKINAGTWRFEVVYEYYAVRSGLFIGRVHGDDESFWCHVSVRYKDLLYAWGNLREDF